MTGHAPQDAANPPRSHRGYIVSPWYDHVFFIWSPLWFLVIGAALSFFEIADVEVTIGAGASARDFYLFPTLALAFSMGHVFAVYFRSYANPRIFRLFPYRFTLVPLVLLAGILTSQLLFIVFFIFITWFDNWHSSLQTFGLGRLYDMRRGNHPLVGRRLDMGLALLTYLGPILAGVTLAVPLSDFERFREVGLDGLAATPGWILAHQLWLTLPIFCGGLLYLVIYVICYVRYARRGYQVSWQKVLLFVVLTLTSLCMWGFDSFGQSFLVMECFHALQYFALMWWSEQQNLGRLFRVRGRRGGKAITWVLFLGGSLAVGVWSAFYSTTRLEIALFLVIEFQHYWYDGFIWSVQKRHL